MTLLTLVSPVRKRVPFVSGGIVCELGSDIGRWESQSMRLLDGTEMKRLGERRVEKTGHIFLQPMCIELEYPERILGFPVACCINRQNGTLGFVI